MMTLRTKRVMTMLWSLRTKKLITTEWPSRTAYDNDANNEVAELQRAIPVQAALHSGCNGAINLLQQFDENND